VFFNISLCCAFLFLYKTNVKNTTADVDGYLALLFCTLLLVCIPPL